MLKRALIVSALGVSLSFMSGILPQNEWVEVQAVAEAKTQPQDIALGGIQLGATMERVRSIYGEPDHKTQSPNNGPFGRVITWTYGSSFKLEFDGDSHTVIGAETTANNGIKLPSGIGVGDNINAAKWHYDSMKQSPKNHYRFDYNWYLGVLLKTNNNGVIQSINMYMVP